MPKNNFPIPKSYYPSKQIIIKIIPENYLKLFPITLNQNFNLIATILHIYIS